MKNVQNITPAQPIAIVEPVAKKTLYTFASDEVNVHATFEFKTGETVDYDLSAFTPEIQQHLMMHGFKQKVVDAAAIQRDAETGASASDSDKIKAMKIVADRLEQGVWRVVGEGAGVSKGGLLQRALAILYPNRDISAWLDKQNDKQKAALRAVPKIAAEIDKIRAKIAVKGSIDADSLLAELGDAMM